MLAVVDAPKLGHLAFALGELWRSEGGYGLVVECVLAKDETRVRFPVAAQITNPSDYIE